MQDFCIISLFLEKMKSYEGKRLTNISDSFLAGRRAGRGGREAKVLKKVIFN